MANFLINNNFFQKTSSPDAPIISDPVFEPRAIFSINASNELQATFWIVKNGAHLIQNLGTASYTIRDKDGTTIGIIESGIVADPNGYYYASAVLADAIQDLTHYVVDLQISAENRNHKGVVGITLGE
jgi:hypothetical protein